MSYAPTVNYAFVENMNAEKAKQLLNYLNENLRAIRKHNRLPEMKDVWMLGKEKVEARLAQLKVKKAETLPVVGCESCGNIWNPKRNKCKHCGNNTYSIMIL